MVAYITQTRKVCFLTIQNSPMDRLNAYRVDVTNKAAARAYCKANGIKPWNF